MKQATLQVPNKALESLPVMVNYEKNGKGIGFDRDINGTFVNAILDKEVITACIEDGCKAITFYSDGDEITLQPGEYNPAILEALIQNGNGQYNRFYCPEHNPNPKTTRPGVSPQ